MDSQKWNLISAVVLALGFAAQWGIMSNRVGNVETNTLEMKRGIERNSDTGQSIRKDVAEIKTMIESHLAAHRGLDR